MKRTIHEYPEKEKNYTKHMSDHIKYLTEQFVALRLEEHDKRSAILTDFVQTLQSVGPSVKLDIFFIHAVLKASAKILESQHLEQAVADQFIFQVLDECSQTLPPKCQESIYYPHFIISCFNALQTIQHTASQEIKSIQSFHDNFRKLFCYIMSTAQPSFKCGFKYMEAAIKTHHLAVEYVEGDLLIPEKSAQFYFNLFLQSHLALMHIPSKIKDSQPFKDLRHAQIAREMEHQIYGVAFGFGVISVGVLFLTQMIPIVAILSLLLGTLTSLIGIGIFAYYSFQIMNQNNDSHVYTSFARP